MPGGKTGVFPLDWPAKPALRPDSSC